MRNALVSDLLPSSPQLDPPTHFIFEDALSILALSARLKQASIAPLPTSSGEGLSSWQNALDAVLEGYLPGSSVGARKPQFLTSKEFERIYFDTVSLKRRLLRQLLPEATAQLPFIFSELETRGVLFRSFQEAAAETERTGAPVWVAASAKFSTPQFVQEDWSVSANESRSILFLSGPLAQEDHDYSDSYFRHPPASSFPPIEMRASLFWIPKILGYWASHADKPPSLKRGEAQRCWVFGAMSAERDRFEIKPYGISGE